MTAAKVFWSTDTRAGQGSPDSKHAGIVAAGQRDARREIGPADRLVAGEMPEALGAVDQQIARGINLIMRRRKARAAR
ncbi:hypothetical protein [Sphingomonas sp. PB4P5]|uniref:hypothetical protein n=1 Tax=Parasphingomonas puruogangriensis TaxID=3096155 RepID=UPI002FCC51FD